MIAILSLVSLVLLWLGVDALLLSRHESPPTQVEKDEMMFGKAHRRPISVRIRMYAERHYPFVTGASMQFYGWLFVLLGLGVGAVAFGFWD